MLNKMRYDSDIVFFGDSITRGSDFQEYFPNVRIVNLGYSGDDLVRSLRRINQIKALMPEKIFLLIGINGLGTKSDIDFKSEYMTLVDSIIQCMPSSELYLQSILPVNEFKKDKSVANNQKISNANQIIQGISKEKGLIYIDLFSLFSHTGGLPDSLTVDGVHLLPSAYQIWAREISGYVEN